MKERFTCIDCGVIACKRNEKDKYPEFCLTKGVSEEEKEKYKKLYTDMDTEEGRVACEAIKTVGENYGKLTRAEEIIVFAKKMGYKKIGIAFCCDVSDEAKVFGKMLKVNGFEVFGAVCKLAAIDKCEIGMGDFKAEKGKAESICNPVMQARIMNEAKTELNVLVGLCVGHDSLFIKYSDALVTNLIVKDRVLAHNPVGALYTSKTYYKKIFREIEG